MVGLAIATISYIMVVVGHKPLPIIVNILLMSVYLHVFVLIEPVAEVGARGRVRLHHLIAHALFRKAIGIGP